MAQVCVRHCARTLLAAGIAVLGMLAFGCAAQAAEQLFEVSPETLDIEELSEREMEPSETLLGYLRERLLFGYGFDEEYNDNIFLDDLRKRDDVISTLEGEILYFDPRGSLLYGLDMEVNAFRYHRENREAINYDGRLFFDLDPGGRIRYRADLLLDVSNSFTLGPAGVDILRRSEDFQRRVEHKFLGKVEYLLSKKDKLRPEVEYTLFDDQVPVNDTDLKRVHLLLDWDRELSPRWEATLGYDFENIERPNSAGNTRSNSARLGLKYEVTEFALLKGLLTAGRTEAKDGTGQTEFGFSGNWKYSYPVLPQLTFTLDHSDARRTSYEVGRLRFRTKTDNLGLLYEVSPLVTLKASANYEKQKSGGKDVLKGTAATSVVNSSYELAWGATWLVRESTHVDFTYRYYRSKTRDVTQHLWIIGFESGF